MEKKALTIVFDLGGVLVGWDPRHLYRKMFQNEEEMTYFLDHVCTMEWNAKQDAGRPFAEAIVEKVAAFPKYRVYIEAFFTRWIEMITGPIEGTVALLQKVRSAGYPVSALSNWSMETFPLVRHEYDFLNWFDTIVLSGEEKLIKPFPEIYQVLLKRIQQPPENCLFIDDSLPNVKTAQQLGFDAIHFQSPAQLETGLMQRGII